MCVTSVRNSCDTHDLNYKMICRGLMNKKQRSLLSKNSNSLNIMIKKTSMTFKNNRNNARKLLAISLATIMVFGSFSLGSLTAEHSVFAAKPEHAGKNDKNVIQWSNGVPSGPHENMIIHGKKWSFEDNCDTLDTDGRSVFTPLYTGVSNQTIEFISNQNSQIENLTAIDPCTQFMYGDPAQVQIPYEENGYYVFWSLKGKPQNGQNQAESNFALAGPTINHLCNVTEAGSLVKEGDSDFGNDLKNFTLSVQHEDTGSIPNSFDIGETVYHDKDSSGNVTDLDVRLVNAGNWTFADGSIVDGDNIGPNDPDVDEDLVEFVNGTEMYRDTDSTMNYTMGEPIYLDVDMSGNVTTDDIRLYVKDGSEALSCSDEDLINGAGAVTDKGAFKLKDGKLERWDTQSTSKGKGKNTFYDLTGMFQWSGAVCNATILDNATINTNGDGQLSIEDFNLNDTDGSLNATDINMTLGVSEATAQAMIAAAEDDAIVIGGQPDPFGNPNLSYNGLIDTDKEFAAFIENEFGGDYNCVALYDEWVFNLAQIVDVGVNVINDGGTTVQVRFYPVDTTTYTPAG